MTVPNKICTAPERGDTTSGKIMNGPTATVAVTKSVSSEATRGHIGASAGSKRISRPGVVSLLPQRSPAKP